jgi:hypothetical protein
MSTLDNPLAVRDAIARLIADVYAGKVHPRIGAGLAPLLNLRLRAIESTELERRLAKLEKKLHAQLEGTTKQQQGSTRLDYGTPSSGEFWSYQLAPKRGPLAMSWALRFLPLADDLEPNLV